MSKLQEQVEKAWKWVEHGSGCCKIMGCSDCFRGPDCDGVEDVEQWLLNHGFPARRARVHTVAELAQQIVKCRSLPCLTQWTAQNVEAVTCPGCGKHTLFRERRMVCNGCGNVYPADKWAAGEPCECGSMDARYYGIHSANRLGQLEFQQCQTPGCRWGGDYRRLTVQELADAAQVSADEQWAAARTCPACGDASGNDQVDGVYLPIERCECGWLNQAKRRRKMIKFESRLNDDFDSKSYAVSEIKEPVIRNIGKSVITRCRYGAEVINMPTIMSIDIDYALEEKGEEQALNETVEIAGITETENPGLAFRIYRTFKGLRVIVLGEEFNPRAYRSLDLMNSFGCDEIYAILCIKQNSFRLRLTPKPERIGIADKYDHSQSWIDQYNSARSGFSSARFLMQIGPDIELPEEIKVHDEMTGSFSGMPLA